MPTPIASSSRIRSSLQQIVKAWPIDRLRPTLQFSEALETAAKRIFEVDASSPSSSHVQEGSTKAVNMISEGKKKQELSESLSSVELVKAERMVQSLRRLLNNEAQHAYPIGEKTLVPASFPYQYVRLREGLEKAERGDFDTGNSGWFSWIRWK